MVSMKPNEEVCLPVRDVPSDTAIIERAMRLCNFWMFTVALQCRRVKMQDSEDTIFISRMFADLQFLITALLRLRRAAKVAARVSKLSNVINNAISEFDEALPDLYEMRNVGEHFDEYAVDSNKRHHKHITRRDLEVDTFNGKVYMWLDKQLNINNALAEAEKLFSAVIRCGKKRYKS